MAPPGVKYVVNLACSRSSLPERIKLDQATRRVRIREQAATDSRALIKSAVRHCQRSQVLIEYSGDTVRQSRALLERCRVRVTGASLAPRNAAESPERKPVA